jgi:hypothetical protein
VLSRFYTLYSSLEHKVKSSQPAVSSSVLWQRPPMADTPFLCVPDVSPCLALHRLILTVQVFLPEFLPLSIYRRVNSIFRVHLYKLLLCICFFRTLSSNLMMYSSRREQRFLGAYRPISSKPLSQITNFIFHKTKTLYTSIYINT